MALFFFLELCCIYSRGVVFVVLVVARQDQRRPARTLVVSAVRICLSVWLSVRVCEAT